MITKFYEKILPTKGNKYCVAWTSGKGMNHEWVDSVIDIEPTIIDLQNKHKEINVFRVKVGWPNTLSIENLYL